MPRPALLALLVCSVVISAEERPKRIWEWTVEERLAQRFDPERIEAREAQYQEDFREQLAKVPPEVLARGATTAPGVIRHTVDGRRNPELFLPHELFDALMTGFVADPDLRRKQRNLFRPSLQEAGFDDALLWAQLAAWGGDYIALRHQRRPPADRDELCRARYAALAAARQHYGPERFEWFLYVTMPFFMTKEGTSVAGDPAAQLRRAESGCRR